MDTTAAISSSLGMVTCFMGATRDFPITSVVCTDPVDVLQSEVSAVSVSYGAGIMKSDEAVQISLP